MAQKKLLTNGKAFKRTDDRWGGTVWYMDEKGERKRKSFSGTTKAEVTKKMTNYVAAFKEELQESDESRRTLKESMTHWLQVFKFPSVERTTYDRCECTVEHEIFPLLGEKVVGDITAADLKEVLNHWMSEGYAYTTVKKVLALVAGFSKKKAETVAKEQRKNQKNSRIIVTKKLLKNYRNLKVSLKCGMEHNLKLLEDYEYQRLMEKEQSVRNQKLTSMSLLTASNQVLWARLNAALDCYKEMCKNETSPSAQRGYKLIYARYLCDTPISISAIEERFAIEHSTFYKNINRAIATLSVILFGSESAEDFCLGDDFISG